MIPTIECEGVSKQFSRGFRYQSLRADISSFARRVLGYDTPRADLFWAVRNLSFHVNKGESIGIIGSNGAGKSTTLKLLSRVSYPSSGSIRIRGKVASLLEAGAGLHPELTGRENIFVNGAILGMRRAEIRRRFNEIVDFSELRDSIDMPVKKYSSGMYVRLGFSVAVHMNPDVLLVDEVLSVGDLAFQTKSLERMLSFRDKGVTIVFVSHSLPAITQMCERVLWMENGAAQMLGQTQNVLAAYLEAHDRRVTSAASATELRSHDIGSGEIVIERLTTHRADGEPCGVFAYRDPLLVRIHYKALTEVYRPSFTISVQHHASSVFFANMEFDQKAPDKLAGSGVIELLFKELPLLPGVYHITGQILRNIRVSYYNARQLGSFQVASPMDAYGYKGEKGLAYSRETCPVVVPYEWRFEAAQGLSAK